MSPSLLKIQKGTGQFQIGVRKRGQASLDNVFFQRGSATTRSRPVIWPQAQGLERMTSWTLSPQLPPGVLHRPN